MEVIKRNGAVVKFDKNKIKEAVYRASEQLGLKDLNDFIQKIADSTEKELKKISTVEEIQDIVVKKLMASKYKDLAVAYQSWRAIRADYRKKEGTIYKKVAELTDKSNDSLLDENANKDAKTISVQRDLLAGITSKEYYLNKVLPNHIADSHNKGEIHIHDLDYLIFKETNCELVNLERMLRGGCRIGNANMTEPNSIEVAVGHTVQIIASVSSNTYGGCTIPYIDRTLVPYIRKSFIKHYSNGLKYIAKSDNWKMDFEGNDLFFETNGIWDVFYANYEDRNKEVFEYAIQMTEDSVKQAIQGLEYEINSLSTVNGQTPFTTLGFGTETSWEGRLVQRYILQTRAKGFGAQKEVAVFPKLVYAVCDGLNFKPEDPNWDISQLAFECMTKSIYPDILFITEEQWKKGTVVYPMG